MALDAIVHASGPSGDRQIPLADFYLLPGATPQIETVLAQGELISGISIPAPAFAARSTYLKVRGRAQFEFALASAAVAVELGDGAIRQARVALGGVGTIPWRSPEAERALAGASVSRASFAAAAEAALRGARGYGKNAYKIPLAKHTLVRALEIVTS